MSPATPLAVLEEFQNALKQEWIQRPICETHQPNVCGCYRSFYNTPRLLEWMHCEAEGTGKNNIELLLASQEFEEPEFSLWGSESIFQDDQQCILVFSCLLALHEGRWLYFFQLAGYRDTNLSDLDDSKKKERLEDELRKYNTRETTINSTIADFEEKKWAFCPALFHDDNKLRLGELQFHNMIILPYCARTQVNQKGGTASVFQVVVQEEFISGNIKRHLGPSFQFGIFGECYEFAVKSYSRGRRETFDNEVKAFRGLHEQPGMVRFFGTYSSLTGNKMTYNIILEFGKMDLFESYDENNPPQRPDEIIANWRLICKVAEAIRDLHELKYLGSNRYDGLHGDIKPDNILLVRNELKLADFGFAEFTKHRGRNVRLPKVKPKGGTESYGAPESDEADKKFDIWSFGCVLSVNATWVVAGSSGVKDFETLRTQSNKAKGAKTITDAFHDGKKVLPQIRLWHDYLNKIMRKSDSITSKILDLVDNSMLRSKPSDRLDSQQLCEKLSTIVRTAEAELKTMNSTIHNDVMVALLSAELWRRELRSNGKDSDPDLLIQVQASDENLLRVPMPGSGLHSPTSSRVKKFAKLRPGISQREETLVSALIESNITVLVVPAGEDSRIEELETHPHDSSYQRQPFESESDESDSVLSAVPYGNRPDTGKWKKKPHHDPVVRPSSPELYTALPKPLDPDSDITVSIESPSQILKVPSNPPFAPEVSPEDRPVLDLAPSPSQGSANSTITTTTVPDGLGRTEAMIHAGTLNMGYLKDLLRRCDDISQQDNEGKTVLHHLVNGLASTPNNVASKDLSDIMNIVQGRDPTILCRPDKKKRTPLFYVKDSLVMARALTQALMASGASIDKDSFVRAVKDGEFQLVDHYLKNGATADWINKQTKDRIKDIRIKKALESNGSNSPVQRASSSKLLSFRNRIP